ncbi:MAG: extracellular solute-binding protein [Lachnospiraceae bacterium]|nr:extracellular solute-binding protein [Lachnospiraceae bacterium]
MKRRIIAIIAIICMLASLTGCSGKGGGTKLTLALRAGTYSEVIKSCLAEFEAENGVTCEVFELSEDDLHSYVLNDIVSRHGAYDLCMVDGSWVSEYLSEGVLADLGKLGYFLDDDIIPATTTICVHGGTTYLVPYYGNVTVMMYNRDIAEELGYGSDDFSSLDDLLDFCKAAKAAGHGGFAYRGDTENNMVVDFLPILRAFGGWVIDDNNDPTIDTDTYKNAMEFYRKLADTGKAMAKDELIAAIESGDAVAAVGWPGWYKAENTSSEYISFPGRVSDDSENYNSNIYGIWTLGIPDNSVNKDLACKLLTYLMDKGVQKKTIDIGGVPCRYSSLKDQAAIAKDPHLEVIGTALENGIYRPVISEWPGFYTILGSEMIKIMNDSVTVEEGLMLAEDELDVLMGTKR